MIFNCKETLTIDIQYLHRLVRAPLSLQNAISEILEIIVEFRRERVATLFDHRRDQRVQLIVRPPDVEAIAQGADCRRAAAKAGQLAAWKFKVTIQTFPHWVYNR